MKDSTMAVIRSYKDLSNRMQAELNQISPDLKDHIREKREAEVKAKYQDKLDANLHKIKQGRSYFEAARLRAADPMKALVKRAWAADDNKPGMAAVTAAMETMGAEAQLELAKELKHPILALQAVANVKKMHLEPNARLNLEPMVQELTAGYVDVDQIRDHAESEQVCLELEWEIKRDSGAPPHDVLSLGHRVDDMKKIIASGQLPKSERISVLTHPDPVDRMQAARKAG